MCIYYPVFRDSQIVEERKATVFHSFYLFSVIFRYQPGVVDDPDIFIIIAKFVAYPFKNILRVAVVSSTLEAHEKQAPVVDGKNFMGGKYASIVNMVIKGFKRTRTRNL